MLQHASAIKCTAQASAAQPSRNASKQRPTCRLLPVGCASQQPFLSTAIMSPSAEDHWQAVILDIRFPTLPVAELQRHQAAVNALAWAPHSSCHICTAGDDAQALIWDLTSMAKPLEQSLGAGGEGRGGGGGCVCVCVCACIGMVCICMFSSSA